jgi:hypothetical protein
LRTRGRNRSCLEAGWGGREGRGGTMCAHISKCANDTIKKDFQEEIKKGAFKGNEGCEFNDDIL